MPLWDSERGVGRLGQLWMIERGYELEAAVGAVRGRRNDLLFFAVPTHLSKCPDRIVVS